MFEVCLVFRPFWPYLFIRLVLGTFWPYPRSCTSAQFHDSSGMCFVYLIQWTYTLCLTCLPACEANDRALSGHPPYIHSAPCSAPCHTHPLDPSASVKLQRQAWRAPANQRVAPPRRACPPPPNPFTDHWQSKHSIIRKKLQTIITRKTEYLKMLLKL